MHVDVHQHIWTPPLLDRLARRDALPMIRHSDGLAVLHSAGEQPYVLDVHAEAAERRARLVHSDGLDLALIAMSSPIGIEALPRDSALDLIEAHLEGVGSLPAQFAAWGPLALDGADPEDVDQLLARGCVGVSLPAGAMAGRDALEQVGPVLERIAGQGAPLLVHPGPAVHGRSAAAVEEPLWWPALTVYVAQMQAAWLTFVSFARREHPELTVVFALLAGCAPLHAERLRARGGPAIDLRDPLIYYETSSYGHAAIEAMAQHVGESQLLYGSDRPMSEPSATGRDARLQVNGGRLFARIGIAG